MGIVVCVYTGLLNMLLVQYWVTTHFIFCLPAGAVEPVSVGLVVYSACYSSDFYIRQHDLLHRLLWQEFFFTGESLYFHFMDCLFLLDLIMVNPCLTNL